MLILAGVLFAIAIILWVADRWCSVAYFNLERWWRGFIFAAVICVFVDMFLRLR